MQAASRPSGRSAAVARRLSVEAVEWLRSDIVDVVALLPGDPAHSGPGATENGGRSPRQLDEALARWSRPFARERRLVLAPRGLSLALSLSALIASVFAVGGAKLNLAVALCVSAPPLVGLAAVLASSWRDPSQRELARVFDRDLALDERVGTAVEISGAGLAVEGLAALVVAEASAALVMSDLSGARPTHRSAQREWLVSAGAVLIASVLLVSIGGRGGSLGLGRLAAGTSFGHPVAPTSVANAHGAKHAHRLITGRTRKVGSDGQRTTASLKSARRNPALSVVTPSQSSAHGGRFPAQGGNQRTLHGALGRSGSQTAGLRAGAGARGAGGGGGTRASAQASTHSAGSGVRVGSDRGTAGRGHSTNPQRAGAGSRAGTFHSTQTSGVLGSARAQASGNSQTHGRGTTKIPSAHSAGHPQRSRSGQGHSVGNSAGTGSGGSAVGRPQANGLPSGSARLPIQVGYNTPARGRSGPKSADPAGRSGGKGRVRSSTENDGGSATAVTLPYIPPSADIGPVDNAVLQHYFSSVPTVSKRW